MWCGGGAGSPKSWGSNQISDFQQTLLPIKQSHDILRVFKQQQVWLVSWLVGFGVLVIEPKALPVWSRCSAKLLNFILLFCACVFVCACVSAGTCVPQRICEGQRTILGGQSFPPTVSSEC